MANNASEYLKSINDNCSSLPINLLSETLHDNDLCPLVQKLTTGGSQGEHRERILTIIEGVGARGFLLLAPQCRLVLEGNKIK